MGELSAYAFELVDYIADTAKSDSISFLQALKNASAAQIKKTADGLVLTGVSANSASSTFSFVSSFKPTQVIELINLLRKMQSLAVTVLASEGNLTPTDEQVVAWIKLNLDDCFVNSIAIDYSEVML